MFSKWMGSSSKDAAANISDLTPGLKGKRKFHADDDENENNEIENDNSRESIKWISVRQSPKGSELYVNPNVRKVVFDKLPDDCVNLISIFGAARQGKSFLMNCLAGKSGVFRISNQRESCTQGIDVSEHTMDIGAFSQVYGGTQVTLPKKSPKIRVGFIDAEGQGDKDITYDANLICPILLASKCVIFNWKDSLQKDRILNLLGIMHKAAINVAAEGGLENDGEGDGNKVFGHLHLLFRDWQYTGSTENDVMKDIFKDERSADIAAAVRNQIRRSVKESFESITIWLFPPPVEAVTKLNTELSYDVTSVAFKEKVKELRATLSTQLSKPMRFDGKILKGRIVGPMVKTIADVLNSGEAIRPASAYVSMMRSEVEQLRIKLEENIRQQVAKLLEEIKKSSTVTSDNTDNEENEHPLPLILAESQANTKLTNLLEKLITEYEQEVIHCVGELQGDLATQVLASSQEAITRVKLDTSNNFHTSYHLLFVSWLKQIKILSEQYLKLSLSQLALPVEPEQLEVDLKSIKSNLLKIFHVSKKLTESYQNEVEDVLSQFQQYIHSQFTIITKTNDDATDAANNQARVLLDASITTMETSLHQVMKSMSHLATPVGVPLPEYQSTLNKKYFLVREELVRAASQLPLGDSISQWVSEELEDSCKEMKGKLDDHYTQTATLALEVAVENANAMLDDRLATILDNDITDAEITEYVQQVSREIENEANENTSRWTCPDSQRQKILLTPLKKHVKSKLTGLLFTNGKLTEMRVKQKKSEEAALEIVRIAREAKAKEELRKKQQLQQEQLLLTQKMKEQKEQEEQERLFLLQKQQLEQEELEKSLAKKKGSKKSETRKSVLAKGKRKSVSKPEVSDAESQLEEDNNKMEVEEDDVIPEHYEEESVDMESENICTDNFPALNARRKSSVSEQKQSAKQWAAEEKRKKNGALPLSKAVAASSTTTLKNNRRSSVGGKSKMSEEEKEAHVNAAREEAAKAAQDRAELIANDIINSGRSRRMSLACGISSSSNSSSNIEVKKDSETESEPTVKNRRKSKK